MNEYRFDEVIDERARVFAMWLAHEAGRDPRMEALRQVFLRVGKDITTEQVSDADHSIFLYGAIRGHARAWGYLADYEQDQKLYLSHYIARVGENDETQ